MPAATTADASSEPSSLLSIVDRTAYDRLIKSIADDLPQTTQQKFRGKEGVMTMMMRGAGQGVACLHTHCVLTITIQPTRTRTEEAKECTDYARARKLIELVLAQSAVIMARPVEKDIEGSYQVRRRGRGTVLLIEQAVESKETCILPPDLLPNRYFHHINTQVLISLLDRLSDPADLPVMVEQLVSNLRSSADEKPSLR